MQSRFADGLQKIVDRLHLERANGVSDNWFARNYGKQFIEAHPLTAAAGYDDG